MVCRILMFMLLGGTSGVSELCRITLLQVSASREFGLTPQKK